MKCFDAAYPIDRLRHLLTSHNSKVCRPCKKASSIMDHEDHKYLLGGGIETRGGIWADFGSGTGAFTLALADLLGSGAEIYSIDRDRAALREQERFMNQRFPETKAHYVVADFTQPIALPPLDGIVMANALHFLKEKRTVIDLIRTYLKPDGRLILVEYNVDRGNFWVPYPLSYKTWERMAAQRGFARTRLLATIPSRFLTEIFAAISFAA